MYEFIELDTRIEISEKAAHIESIDLLCTRTTQASSTRVPFFDIKKDI